tara:strand:+ start:681 stop:860 length:180 start_codon:yes stop_codon:yes gene_type:complete
MSEMSRIRQPSNEGGLEDSHVEGVAGERDPIRSIDNVSISKLKVVVNGETIYDYGREEE